MNNKKNCFTVEWYNTFMDMNILIVDDDKAVTDSIEFIILEWAERNHCKINYQIKKHTERCRSTFSASV